MEKYVCVCVCVYVENFATTNVVYRVEILSSAIFYRRIAKKDVTS